MTENEIEMAIRDLLEKDYAYFCNQDPFPREKWRHQIVQGIRELLKNEDTHTLHYYLNMINYYFSSSSRTKIVKYSVYKDAEFEEY